MDSHFDLTGQQDTGSSYAALPGTSGNGFVQQNATPNKAVLSSGREVAGCHPSRWIYEVTNNNFTVCDLFDRARRANIDSPYAWDHQHKLVINGNQSASEASSERLSAVCLDCHFHFVFKMKWQDEHAASLCHHNQSGWPPKDDKFPWHHLVWIGSDSDVNITRDSCKYYPIQARETFVCSAAPCTFELTLEVSEPRMPKWWVKLLLDHEAIREQLDIAKQQDPARYEGATDEWAYQAPLNLNTYLKNQLESTPENSRSISKRNKRFCVLFGPRCFAVFRQLEFLEKEVDNDGVDEGSFTPVAPPAAGGPNGTTELNTYRAYLEDVRSEVQCLIHKAGQVAERPTYIAPALHAILRCAEIKDVASYSHVNADRYQILGVLPTQSREIVVNAYKRQWEVMPTRRKALIESLLAVANDSQDDLLIDYAITQSSVFDSQPQQQATGNDSETISQSLAFLGLNPPNHYSAEAIIEAFRTKIVQEPAEASTARNVLMWIASESRDDHYQAKLLMEADQKMSLETAKAILGLKEGDDLVQTAPGAARKRLQECSKPEAKKVYLEALDSVAEHTASLSLKQAAVELTHESSSAGSGALSGSASNAPVNFSLPVGLDNIGNTCYLNSLLQYLFTVKPIRDVIFNYDDLKLGLADQDIEKRRIGGNKMQMDRGEAVVADAFARELATLFENLQASDKAATRPSQRLANAVLLSTRTLLDSTKSPPEPAIGPKPPPLPTRPSPPPPTTTKNEAEDIEMVNVDGALPEFDTVSLSSTRTLVHQEDADGSDPSYEKVERVPGGVSQQDIVTTEIQVIDDAEMVDGSQANETSASPLASVQEVSKEADPATRTADIQMTDAEEPESVDTKVLNALEHQKRSSGTDQQDVEEVMGSIINRLQAAIRPSSIDEKTGVQLEKLMETFFVTTVNYTKKFHEKKYQHEISFDRSITAYPAEDGPCSLYDALGRNFDQQILEESKLSRYTAIKTLPPILHVLIQRTTSKGSKNGNPVVIPETLYLDRFMDMDHDSAGFQRRVEDWITAKRITDIKTQLAKVEPNPTYMRSLENYSSAIPEPLDPSASINEDDAINIEVETWDFDGPVEDDFLLVSSKQPESQLERPLPKVEGIYETHVHIKEMMEQELKEREKTIEEHHESLTQIPYRLHAVICHRGHLMSGHYWVWIHDFEENVWRWYNDADVKENKDTAEVLQTLSTSGEPYFLCYVRDEDKDNFVDVPKREAPPQPEPEPEAEPQPEPEPATEKQQESEIEEEKLIETAAPAEVATEVESGHQPPDVADAKKGATPSTDATEELIEL